MRGIEENAWVEKRDYTLYEWYRMARQRWWCCVVVAAAPRVTCEKSRYGENKQMHSFPLSPSGA